MHVIFGVFCPVSKLYLFIRYILLPILKMCCV